MHIASACGGKSCRFSLCALGDIANGLVSKWSDCLELELFFTAAELKDITPRSYKLSPNIRVGARCWTDASFEPAAAHGGAPKMKLCAIVANNSSKWGVVCDVPPAFYSFVIPRETHITMGELLAVCLIPRFFREYIEHASNISFIDNMGVIHSIVNGTARVSDLSAFTHALHRKLVKIKADFWWEYVASASNISDGGSRIGITCPLAREAGIHLTYVEFKMPPPLFPFCSIYDWDNWWL